MLTWIPWIAGLLSAPPPQEPIVVPGAEEERWELSAALYFLDPPGEDVYASPIVRADRGGLHLEARYAYEDRDAASFFVGGNLSYGDELVLDLTPIVGLVVGSVQGVAPGLELELAWKGLSFTSESEFLIGFDSETEDYLYSWNELSYSPADWVRFGLAGQRTRIFDQELEVDRGLLLGFAAGDFWIDLYVFNPDQDDPYGVLAVGADF